MTENPIHAFSIRVYSIIVNSNQEILLGEEYHFDQFMCKFPGGGLEFGEGTIDCLKREVKEEMGQEIEVGELFHTTDYFQPILVRPGFQLLSIYYKANLLEEAKFKLNQTPFEHTKAENGSVTFRWHPLSKLDESIMTFPSDKQVVKKLINKDSKIWS